MKLFPAILLLLFLVTVSFPAVPQELNNPSKPKNSIKWYRFEEAYKLNKKKPKKIFIDVFTEWCGWCKKMDAVTFTNPVIIDYMNKHFYCVKLDAEQKDTIIIDGTKLVNPNPGDKRSTHQLAVDLLRGKMSYPSYVFLNEKSQVLSVVPGFQQPVDFEPVLHYFGEDAYLNTTWDTYRSGFAGTIK